MGVRTLVAIRSTLQRTPNSSGFGGAAVIKAKFFQINDRVRKLEVSSPAYTPAALPSLQLNIVARDLANLRALQ